MSDAYLDFLERKVLRAPETGFAVSVEEINPELKPHTRAIVRWALAGGRRAIFARFGLHKTSTQIEILRLILQRHGGAGLIVLPLGVRQEFMRDSQMRFAGAYSVRLKFIRSAAEIEPGVIHLTNYETVRDGKLDPSLFIAASLDEASVLRSFGSKTYQTFLRIFDGVRFRFVATATPNPNRHKELIHYAGFLGVMDTGQALTRFFQRNSEKAGDLTLYPHKEREFWLWMSSWAVFLQKPSDLGFSDEGYDLPELRVIYHEVRGEDAPSSAERDGQMNLIAAPAIGVTGAAREKRSTLNARVAKASQIVVSEPDAHFILWHDLEDERRAISKALPEAVAVYGAQDLEERERAIVAFSDGAFRLLSAKPIIAGSGCNFQRHCHRAVFVGIGFKFNDFIQAIHRIQRFQQAHPVRIDVIHGENEREVLRELQHKWREYEEMNETMSAIIREFGLDQLSMAAEMTRAIGVERIEVSGESFRIANNDCVLETRRMAEASIDLIVTSIPFSNHYEYTPSYNDFGHTDDDAHFFGQMDHLTPELLRILKPGRMACIHVKDRILFGSVTGNGAPTVNPFHMTTALHYLRHGFLYMGMITVVTDVVRENNQTYRLGYSEMLKDSTKMGVGSPEYVLLFRKPQTDRSRGYADAPVKKTAEEYSLARWQLDAHAFWRSSGDRQPTPDEFAGLSPEQVATAMREWSLSSLYDFQHHVRIGEALDVRGQLPYTFMALAPGSSHPDVWHDVTRMLTLNTAQSASGREKHICPLQFDIVDRLIERYSMRGDTVFDPFGGLMTVPYRAIKLGRRGEASELNHRYFLDGVKYCEAAERERAMPSLFDLMRQPEPDCEAA